MVAPSDHFLCLLCGGPLRSIYLLTMWGPLQISFFTYYIAPPSCQFLRILYRGGGSPHVRFFVYYVGAPSDQFFRILYGGPLQVSIFAYYRGPSSDQFLRILYGSSRLGSVSLRRICFVLSYYMGAPKYEFFCILYGASSRCFLRLLYGGPLRSISLLTMWGPP